MSEMKFYVGKAKPLGGRIRTIYSPNRRLIQKHHNSEFGKITEFQTDIVWEGYENMTDDCSYLVFVIREGKLICVGYDHESFWKEEQDVGYEFGIFERG